MSVTFGPSKSHPSYNTFLVLNPPLGYPALGGYLICCSGGTKWIVAPSSTEVSRTWHCRNNAVTTAESNAACGDWFVPTIDQLRNSGYCCKTYWDSYSSTIYWSSTDFICDNAFTVCFINGSTLGKLRSNSYCVRAFRCVCY